MKKTYKNRLPKNMEASSIYAKVVEGEIIVEVEMKEKIQPKDGDFLYLNGCGVFIYKHSIYADCCDAYCGVECKGRINLGNYAPYWCHRNNCRYATPEEKADFLKRLEKECSKRWNPETKELEDIRWEPTLYETYFFINDYGAIAITKYMGSADDIFRCSIGNCFKTGEAAQVAVDQIREIFKNSKAE